MKNLKITLKISLLFLLVFTSCNKDVEIIEDLDQAARAGSDTRQSLGVYCGTQMAIRNLPDSDTRGEDAGDGANSRQRVFDFVPITDVGNITIFIDDCFDDLDMYLDAFQNSVDAYNNIPCTIINITVVDNAEDADIVMDCLPGDEDDCTIFGVLGGTAIEFFDGDNTTNSILINSNLPGMVDCCGAFGACDLTGLFIHEIGHVIGIAHTNEPSSIFFPSSLIPGTPNLDANSIFNGGSLCAGVCEFSVNDRNALQTLYPDEPTELSLSITGLCCDPRPNLLNDDCQIYHAYATPNAGGILDPSWNISPMTGVTIYGNSETENPLRFSFDETVTNGDDFVINLTATIDCVNDETHTAYKIVEVYSCEGEEGGDQ